MRHARTAAEYLQVRCQDNPLKTFNGISCLEWTARKTKAGYGYGTYKNAYVYAHRLSYETSVGPIPAHLEIDHLCFNRACLRPEHLEPVTPTENARRFHARKKQLDLSYKKSVCNKGHKLSAANIYRFPCEAETVRRCLICYTAYKTVASAAAKKRRSAAAAAVTPVEPTS